MARPGRGGAAERRSPPWPRRCSSRFDGGVVGRAGRTPARDSSPRAEQARRGPGERAPDPGARGRWPARRLPAGNAIAPEARSRRRAPMLLTGSTRAASPIAQISQARAAVISGSPAATPTGKAAPASAAAASISPRAVRSRPRATATPKPHARAALAAAAQRTEGGPRMSPATPRVTPASPSMTSRFTARRPCSVRARSPRRPSSTSSGSWAKKSDPALAARRSATGPGRPEARAAAIGTASWP